MEKMEDASEGTSQPVVVLDANDPSNIRQLVKEMNSSGILQRVRQECSLKIESKSDYQCLENRVRNQVTNFLLDYGVSWTNGIDESQLQSQLRQLFTEYQEKHQLETERLKEEISKYSEVNLADDTDEDDDNFSPHPATRVKFEAEDEDETPPWPGNTSPWAPSPSSQSPGSSSCDLMSQTDDKDDTLQNEINKFEAMPAQPHNSSSSSSSKQEPILMLFDLPTPTEYVLSPTKEEKMPGSVEAEFEATAEQFPEASSLSADLQKLVLMPILDTAGTTFPANSVSTPKHDTGEFEFEVKAEENKTSSVSSHKSSEDDQHLGSRPDSEPLDTVPIIDSVERISKHRERTSEETHKKRSKTSSRESDKRRDKKQSKEQEFKKSLELKNQENSGKTTTMIQAKRLQEIDMFMPKVSKPKIIAPVLVTSSTKKATYAEKSNFIKPKRNENLKRHDSRAFDDSDLPLSFFSSKHRKPCDSTSYRNGPHLNRVSKVKNRLTENYPMVKTENRNENKESEFNVEPTTSKPTTEPICDEELKAEPKKRKGGNKSRLHLPNVSEPLSNRIVTRKIAEKFLSPKSNSHSMPFNGFEICDKVSFDINLKEISETSDVEPLQRLRPKFKSTPVPNSLGKFDDPETTLQLLKPFGGRPKIIPAVPEWIEPLLGALNLSSHHVKLIYPNETHKVPKNKILTEDFLDLKNFVSHPEELNDSPGLPVEDKAEQEQGSLDVASVNNTQPVVSTVDANSDFRGFSSPITSPTKISVPIDFLEILDEPISPIITLVKRVPKGAAVLKDSFLPKSPDISQ